MTKLTIQTVSGFSPAQVDAAAKALRDCSQAGRRLNTWDTVPNSQKRKWYKLAAIALGAASASIDKDIAAEGKKLCDFARWVIREGALEALDLSGEDILDEAVKRGILKEVEYNPAIHGDSDYAKPGDPWFVFASDQLKGSAP